MALAFGGLLLETVPSCDQFGFIFVVGVLVDTFLIRPVLVPAILSFADYWNWYPTRMPMQDLKDEYHRVTVNTSTKTMAPALATIDDSGYASQGPLSNRTI